MKRPEPTPELFPAELMPFNLVGETMPQEPEPTPLPPPPEEIPPLF
jgi:hypothetical protein